MNLYPYPHWKPRGSESLKNQLCPYTARLNTESSKQIFPEKELRGRSPNSYIHVSVSDLFLPTIGLPILLQDNSFFLYLFWRATVCWPLLCLFRPFMVFEGCLISNSECCRSKRTRYKLSHPSQLLPPIPLGEENSWSDICSVGRYRTSKI
jgi:hypothetical protein